MIFYISKIINDICTFFKWILLFIIQWDPYIIHMLKLYHFIQPYSSNIIMVVYYYDSKERNVKPHGFQQLPILLVILYFVGFIFLKMVLYFYHGFIFFIMVLYFLSWFYIFIMVLYSWFYIF
jgi:hypothetical protein